jgi:hypothetical protein
VPPPGAQNPYRHGLRVIVRKTLRAGDIEVESKLAVAHRHSAVGISGVYYYVMAAHEGVSVDGAIGRDRGEHYKDADARAP